jgi:HK97 gp10 family phage protein
MDFTIRIKGDKELIALLKSIPKREATKGIRKGARAGAKIVLAAAKQLAPVYQGPPRDRITPGLLRDKLTVRALSKRGIIGAKVQTGSRDKMRISPKDKWYYPTILEFGTKDGRLPAQHYMLRAAQQQSQPALSAMIDAIKTAIEAAKA